MRFNDGVRLERLKGPDSHVAEFRALIARILRTKTGSKKVGHRHLVTPSSPLHFFCPMIPRHLRRAVVTPAAPAQIRALLLSRQSLRSVPLAVHPAVSARVTSASFHSSARRQNELPKSPFQTFVEVLKEELKKNRELQDNVKQLQGDVEKFQDSEAMKRAKEAYERARVRRTRRGRV